MTTNTKPKTTSPKAPSTQMDVASELTLHAPAPDFQDACVVDPHTDQPHPLSLRSLRGKTVILYFYPKDDTPGCTTQACALRDEWTTFTERPDIALFGVSPDSPEKHRAFIDKYNLPFSLISDPERKLIEAYRVWVEKSLYGNKYMGTERSTFVIAPDGTLQAILRKVAPKQHFKKLLKALK